VRIVTAAALASAAAALTFGAGAAPAELSHPFISSFNGSGTPAGSMIPVGVAVDNSKSASQGDVYVTDFTNKVVDRFSTTGTYLTQLTGVPAGPFEISYSQDAVNAAGDVFVGGTFGHVVDEFAPDGSYLSQVQLPEEGMPFAVAVDSSGEVLVADGGTGKDVLKYDPSTESVSTFASGTPDGPFGSLWGVAVDNDPSSPAYGDVYVVDADANAVDIFASSGTYLSQLTGTPSGPFEPSVLRDVVDPATGNLYVTDGDTVDEFSPSGAFLTETRTPGQETAYSVAVNAESEDLYVDEAFRGVVDVFGPAVIVPNVDVSITTGVQPTEATLNGKVELAGGGEVTGCEFDYGTSASYGEKAGCAPAGPYATDTTVSAGITGLTPDTTYHFRLTATNANGANYSEDGSFETTGPSSIEGEEAPEPKQTAATLTAKVDPHGFPTTFQVEYGETESYGHTAPVPAAAVGNGTAPQTVSQTVGGLKLKTGYHYRFVAESSQGTTDGPDETLTTASIASIENQSWIGGPKGATIKGRLDVHGAASKCELQYVSEAEFNTSQYAQATTMPCTPAMPQMNTPQYVIVRPTGLAADTPYVFHFVISNEYGEEKSADQSFATFGLESFGAELVDGEGKPFSQAGGHPYELTTRVVFNKTTDQGGNVDPSGNIKDVHVQLPPGLIGNPLATARCTRRQSEDKRCSGASQIGTIEVTANGENNKETFFEPLFNLVPPAGDAAEFGARFNGFVNAFITAHVRTGGDYGISADALKIATLVPVTAVVVKIWGVPADSSHDAERRCPDPGSLSYDPPPCSISSPLRPLLTTPTSCSGPLRTSVLADSYQAPSEEVEAHVEMPGMEGCEKLRFTPTIHVTPESSSADTPTGLHVDLHIPQEESAGGLAEAELKDASVTLPAGIAVNPSAADGLTGCSEAQIELKGPEPASCPDASKIGSVELTTPLVDHPLNGAIYVARQGNAGAVQGSNEFHSLLALYIAIDDPQTGVVVKLAGKVAPDPLTGQLATTFGENPQLPFEDLKLDFFGGQRAALATPRACGTYTTTSSLAPWSGGAVAAPTAPFSITSEPGGGACANPGFAPVLSAGTVSNQAGGFSPFTLSLTRNDGEQRLSTISTTLPLGLAGLVAKVPLCGEAQANAGTCSAVSQIGHVSAAAGVGSDPVVLPERGRQQDPVFLTGPYEGAPFGLSIVVPAQAGPFDLGTVVMRARIMVDPHTAQVTVVSDPLPTILQGVPLDVRTIDVTIDREGFIFNPTNCEPTQVDGTIGSAEGASAAVSSRFQAAGCQSLPFKPSFKASTSGKTSRKNGAGLRVALTYPKAPFGTEANTRSVHVELPKALPSRLSTLNHACLDSVFNQNPAGCPSQSRVGFAKAVTPVLPVPLEGPAYFVSHGGQKFPELIMVLQGYGVTLELAGETFISKAGITSSTFKSVPDVPVSSFELTLPEGAYSALAANTELCAASLTMPTVFTAQNGAVLKQNTQIAVTGCKPAIRAVGHSVKGAHASIRVTVPSAGTLVATGAGIERSVKHVAKAGTVTIGVTLSSHGLRVLAKNPHERVNAKVDLGFRRTHGAPLTTGVRLLLG
jgi:hypothetical protein